MTKRFVLLIGMVVGLLLGELIRRPKMQRLAVLETQEAHREEVNAQRNREWQREVDNMPFDERMDWELFEAGLKLDGYIKGDDDDA